MAFERIAREPRNPRKRKCVHCHNKGRCSCQERMNILEKGPNGPKPCTQMCGEKGRGVMCGWTIRSQICGCPSC